MKRSIWLWLLLLLCSYCRSQTSLTKQIKIDDQLPNISLGHFITNPGKETFTDDLKGKWVILDFWDIWCHACIESMPLMDSLQEKYKDQLRVYLITKNKEENVKKLLKKIRLSLPHLALIAEDTLLSNLFPYATVPHQVWIDTNGVVRYITGGRNANERNIESVLKGKKIKAHFKNEVTDFDRSKPLWIEGGGRLEKNLQYYSFVMNKIDEFEGSQNSITTDTAMKRITIRLLNCPLLILFQIAYNKGLLGGLFDYQNRIILDVRAKERFQYPSDPSMRDEWRQRNLYSYELGLPLDSAPELFSLMKQDLNRYFPYESKAEKRKIKCFVIVGRPKRQMINDDVQDSLSRYIDGTFTINNKTLENSLLPTLNFYNSSLKTPFINGTKYKGKVSMELHACITDISDLRKELKRYGFDIRKRKRAIDILVIKDKQP